MIPGTGELLTEAGSSVSLVKLTLRSLSLSILDQVLGKMILSLLATATTFAALIASSSADPNDWVNLEYVFDSSARSNRATSDARQSISDGAQQTAKGGPWTVTNTQGMLPPNGNPHDYLSWAPYHWPDCNWCNAKQAREEYLRNGGTTAADIPLDSQSNLTTCGSDPAPRRLRMNRMRRSAFSVDDIVGRNTPMINAVNETLARSLSPNLVQSMNATPTISLINYDKRGVAKCTPSPTTHMAPSATWTTCPYAVRDGKVNPDVLTLTGSKSMVHMSQSVLYNAISYVIQGGQSFSQQASSFLDTFFLEPATSINPNVNFGQLVRGPGPKGRIGTFTGILDLRGMVKVVNAIAMLMYAKSPHWTDQKHAAMRNWMGQYRSWLETSSLGKEVASKPNNHASFYISQLAVTNIYVGDLQRAQGVLQKYFNSTFSDQIAISGEQPFEAVRTRPFHYRCFNLEAMITNAKLGDELGMNFWKAKSKYGATIQTAVDYAMAQNPKDEDVTELAPHVAAVAAAYGDPSGKYAAFLRRIVPDYQGQPFWYYDQAQALPNSPGARLRSHSAAHRDQSVLWDVFGLPELGRPDVSPPDAASNTTNTGSATAPNASSPITGDAGSSNPSAGDSSGGSPVSFQCPAVFDLGEDVEIDDGVFVTCDQLRPFYELPPVGA